LGWDVPLSALLPAGHRYASRRRLPARALAAARRRLAVLAPARPSPPDPFGLQEQPGRWLVLAGPDARPVDLPGAEVVHVPPGPDDMVTDTLRAQLAARADGS